jgi:multisubunit Na+/H+ antiporter MnhE subunit
MPPILFAALTGLWQLCGGHVTLGSVVGFLIACIYYECRRNFLAAVILYYVVCLIFWIVCDSIWGLVDSAP